MKRIGKALGFEKEFYENAIGDILENKYIVDTAPEFSSKNLAEKFIRDGLVLAAVDNEIHAAEETWLRSVAEKNGLSREWFDAQKISLLSGSPLSTSLEVDSLTVQY